MKTTHAWDVPKALLILAFVGGLFYGGYRLLAWLQTPVAVNVFAAVVGVVILAPLAVDLLDEFGVGHDAPVGSHFDDTGPGQDD